jgi:ubiquinone/menaquinone biosynthesis C-methylase UbiE
MIVTMPMPEDRWAKWLFENRYGGNQELFNANTTELCKLRDKILRRAQIRQGDVVLDVGTGDGLLAVKALELVGAKGKVIFSDVSSEALDRCTELVKGTSYEENSSFMLTSADNLHEFSNASVDVIVCRSVLMYVVDKQECFREFYRVLRHAGRLSIAEPINRFGKAIGKELNYLGYDLTPLGNISRKLLTGYQEAQRAKRGTDTNPILDFDERDLLRYAHEVGFPQIDLQFNAFITSPCWFPGGWNALLNSAPNPNAPILKDLIDATLDDEERMRFCEYMESMVTKGRCEDARAIAFLRATKRA